MSSPEPKTWRIITVGLLLYAFLYDNANSLPAAAGYRWTRLTSMPRQVRLLEIAVMAILLVIAVGRGTSRTTQYLLAGSFAFGGLALASYARAPGVPPIDAVRLAYMYLLPAFIFIIAREAPTGWRAWKDVFTVTLAWVLVSGAVSWVQFAWLGYAVGDDITGLNKDAHANAMLMMLMGLQFCAFALFLGSRKGVLLALVLFATMILSSALKVMFFGIAAVAVLLATYLRYSGGLARHGIRWSLAAAGATVLIFFVFSRIDVISYGRMTDVVAQLRDDPAGFGPFQAHRAALKVAGRDLPTLALGSGPFTYANPISVGHVLENGRLGLTARGELLSIGGEKGERTMVTLTSSLLAEFGTLAFVAVALMYFSIGHAVWRCCRYPSLHVRARAAGVLACLVVLGLVMVSSLFGSIDVMSVSWPLMLLAGITCRLGAATSAAPDGPILAPPSA